MIDLRDLAYIVGLSYALVLGASKSLRKVWPRIRPVVLIVWTRLHGQIMARLDKLEDRVDIIEAVTDIEHPHD